MKRSTLDNTVTPITYETEDGETVETEIVWTDIYYSEGALDRSALDGYMYNSHDVRIGIEIMSELEVPDFVCYGGIHFKHNGNEYASIYTESTSSACMLEKEMQSWAKYVIERNAEDTFLRRNVIEIIENI